MTSGQRGTLGAAILGSAIVFLDGTFVYLALQRIGAELPSTILGRLEGQTYVNSGYLATLAAFLVLAGALGDSYGRRRMFLVGLVGFGATSVLCGLAPNMELLVVGRLLQGVAGALLVPGSLSIITHTFEGPSRARAFGLWAAVTSALATLGPPIGGILLELAGWRSLFLINVPLVGLGGWLAWRYMDESRSETASRRFDWLGAIVVAVAVGGLAFGAIRGYQSHWQEPVALVALGLGAVAFVAFPFLMARSDHPLVPLGLFRIRGFSTINLSTLLIYGALYTNAGFQALFLQGTLRYTPLGAALIGIPTGILLTILSTRIGTLSGRLGVRRFLVIGSREEEDDLAVGGRLARPAARRAHRSPARRPHLRRRAVRARRAAHDRADELRAGAQRGARVGDQQRALAGGPAARRGGRVHRHQRHLLRGAGRRGAGH